MLDDVDSSFASQKNLGDTIHRQLSVAVLNRKTRSTQYLPPCCQSALRFLRPISSHNIMSESVKDPDNL